MRQASLMNYLQIVKSPILWNAILFQAIWFACVVGSTYGYLWPAVFLLGVLAVWQLHPERRQASDIKLVLIALVMGLVIDSAWVLGGVLEYPDAWPNNGLAPAWIIVMWAGFALTINHSLKWMKLHPSLPLIGGLVGGPLAYFSGMKLGAVEFLIDPVQISIMLAIAWAFALSVLFKVSQGSSAQEPVSQAQSR